MGSPGDFFFEFGKCAQHRIGLELHLLVLFSNSVLLFSSVPSSLSAQSWLVNSLVQARMRALSSLPRTAFLASTSTSPFATTIVVHRSDWAGIAGSGSIGAYQSRLARGSSCLLASQLPRSSYFS